MQHANELMDFIYNITTPPLKLVYTPYGLIGPQRTNAAQRLATSYSLHKMQLLMSSATYDNP